MFSFVIAYLRFLRNIPLLPHIFDRMLLLGLFFTNRAIIDLMDELDTEISSWPGVHAHFHKYGGMQYDLNHHEIGHIHGNGLVDMLIDKKTATRLISERIALPHHTLKDSGWISFYLKDRADFANAIYLFHISYHKKGGTLKETEMPPGSGRP
jgi:hypothetical protein